MFLKCGKAGQKGTGTWRLSPCCLPCSCPSELLRQSHHVSHKASFITLGFLTGYSLSTGFFFSFASAKVKILTQFIVVFLVLNKNLKGLKLHRQAATGWSSGSEFCPCMKNVSSFSYVILQKIYKCLLQLKYKNTFVYKIKILFVYPLLFSLPWHNRLKQVIIKQVAIYLNLLCQGREKNKVSYCNTFIYDENFKTCDDLTSYKTHFSSAKCPQQPNKTWIQMLQSDTLLRYFQRGKCRSLSLFYNTVLLYSLFLCLTWKKNKPKPSETSYPTTSQHSWC